MSIFIDQQLFYSIRNSIRSFATWSFRVFMTIDTITIFSLLSLPSDSVHFFGPNAQIQYFANHTMHCIRKFCIDMNVIQRIEKYCYQNFSKIAASLQPQFLVSIPGLLVPRRLDCFDVFRPPTPMPSFRYLSCRKSN